MEPGEPPRPARERAVPETGPKIECTMAERDVFARVWWVQDDVAVQRGRTSCLLIHDPRADLDLLEVRGRDRAEITSQAQVGGALLRQMESAAAPGVLRVLVVARVSGS